MPLARLAMSRYDKDNCECFKLDYREDEYDVRDAMLDEKMHKAIAVMQFKLEGQLIMEHPEFEMEHRLLLDKIDIKKGTVIVEGVEYPLRDTNFPTIDWEHPYELSPGGNGCHGATDAGVYQLREAAKADTFPVYAGQSLQGV